MVSYTDFHSKVSSAAGVVMCKLADVHKAKMGAAILLKKNFGHIFRSVHLLLIELFKWLKLYNAAYRNRLD